MLDCVYADGALAYRRGALDHLQILDLGVDGRLFLQIFAPEFNSMVRRCGMKLERDLFARVQCGAAKARRLGYRMLKLRRRGHARLTSRDSDA